MAFVLLFSRPVKYMSSGCVLLHNWHEPFFFSLQLAPVQTEVRNL